MSNSAYDEMLILRRQLREAERQITALQDALKPFAAFDDGQAPFTLPITQGSGMARRQLTIGDCRNAKQALEKSYEGKTDAK